MRVPSMHWIRTRPKRFAFATPVRGIPCAFAVNNVRRNGQNGLRMDRVSIRRMLPQLAHEHGHDRGCYLVHAIIVVPEHWELALGLVINDQSTLVTHHFDARITDR